MAIICEVEKTILNQMYNVALYNVVWKPQAMRKQTRHSHTSNICFVMQCSGCCWAMTLCHVTSPDAACHCGGADAFMGLAGARLHASWGMHGQGAGIDELPRAGLGEVPKHPHQCLNVQGAMRALSSMNSTECSSEYEALPLTERMPSAQNQQLCRGVLQVPQDPVVLDNPHDMVMHGSMRAWAVVVWVAQTPGTAGGDATPASLSHTMTCRPAAAQLMSVSHHTSPELLHQV
jgi:hypothetical protein